MTTYEISELQGLLDAFISQLDQATDQSVYESPLYWRLVTRRSAAVAAYEASINRLEKFLAQQG